MPQIELHPVVDDIETVPEPFRESYESRDGKFVLAKPIAIDDPDELRSALRQERARRKEATSNQNVLPPEIQERLSRLDALEQQELERTGRHQEALQRTTDRFQNELKAREERVYTLTSTLTKTLSRDAATSAINALRGDVEALMPHILPHLQVVENAKRPGHFEVFVVEKDDPEAVRLNAQGRPMTVEELAAELREHRTLSKLFDASPANGSGGSGSSFAKGGPRVVRLSAEEARDTKRYQQLKDQKARGEIDGAVDDRGRRLV
ncbi:hypothetical protein [Gemmatimonas sp.]|uniref:hypothetical protein n=1 Tax=Gemmatimonas sp. TaxID=1962908 RepID=UPI003DA4DEAE